MTSPNKFVSNISASWKPDRLQVTKPVFHLATYDANPCGLSGLMGSCHPKNKQVCDVVAEQRKSYFLVYILASNKGICKVAIY